METHFSQEQIQEWSKLLVKPASMTARMRLNAEVQKDEFKSELKQLEFTKLKLIGTLKSPKQKIKKNNGRFYIQDPAPTMPLRYLAPKPGEVIGDLCSSRWQVFTHSRKDAK